MRLIFVILPVFLAAACTAADPQPPETKAFHDSTALSDPVIPQDTISDKPTQPDTVQFSFTYTLAWCNGSYPPQEVLADLGKPKRLYHTPLLLRGENKTYELVTDKKGRARAVLGHGTYQLFFDEQGSFKKSPVTFSCDLYFARHWGEVSIGEGDTSARITIDLPCDLCDPDAKKRP